MQDDLKVRVTYRNEKMEPVITKEYTLDCYTSSLKYELMRIITDVEDALYMAQDNKQKEDWDENVLKSFVRIRHKLLDEANAIERLPQDLLKEGEEELGELSL